MFLAIATQIPERLEESAWRSRWVHPAKTFGVEPCFLISVDHAKDDFKEPEIKLFADCLDISPAPSLESRRRVVKRNNLREPSCQKEAVAGWKEILSSVSSYYHASRPSTVSSPPFSVTGSGWKWLARRRVVMRGEAQPLQLTSMAWLDGTSWDH